MTRQRGIQYLTWLLGIVSLEYDTKIDTEEAAFLCDRRFLDLERLNLLMWEQLTEYDGLIAEMVSGELDAAIQSDSERAESLVHWCSGVSYPAPVARSIRLTKAAIRRYNVDEDGVSEETKETVDEMYKRYERCHVKIKKEGVYRGQDGEPRINGSGVFWDQMLWFRRCMTDDHMFRNVYRVVNEDQVVGNAAEDFTWYLRQRRQRHNNATSFDWPAALRWSNDPVGVAMPEMA